MKEIQIKERLVSWLLHWLMKNQPNELRAAMKAASDKDAQAIALQTTMLYLDRMGLLHCAMCPQRFGLQRTTIEEERGTARDTYLCVVHYSQAQKLVHANGNGSKLEAV